MQIKENKQGDIITLEVDGRLDSSTSSAFSEAISRLVEAGNKIFLIDLARMNYISSAGLRVFLGAAKQLETAKGRIVLSGLSHEVKDVFDISGFTALFEIVSSQQEALQILQSQN